MIHKVVIIGSGKLARALCPVLLKNEIQIDQIFSRNLEHAKNLATPYKIRFTDDYNILEKNADLYLVCVNDDAITEVSESLSRHLDPTDRICHTSGSRGVAAISGYFHHRACLWPMQSFSHNTQVNWSEVPIFLSGSDSILEEIEKMCRRISQKVYRLDEEKKKWVHVAAVFANNFSNYNLTITKKILDSCGVPLDVMEPMMDNMMRNVFHIGPANTQSGPANRGDRETIEMHRKMLLEKFPEYENLYLLFSEIILQKK
jgi:predicted short-subunit dehydrogenase-like oxidoreductase (DUF2520 family)